MDNDKCETGPSTEEKSEKQDHINKQHHEEQAIQVKFPKRKRARTEKRKRTTPTESDTKEAATNDEHTEELSRNELILLKEAQQLRTENHLANLHFRASKPAKTAADKTKKANETGDDDIINGLASDFAVEQSTHAVEERMGRYIEEKMKAKFGQKGAEDGGTAGNGSANDEYDLFAIPEKLQVPERPTYDPGDNLPVAGVEEVDLPDEVKERNIRETARARRGLLGGKNYRRDGERESETLPGNLSANFVKHRTDWIIDNLGNMPSEAQSTSASGETRRVDEEGRVHGSMRQKRFQMATDSVVVERFKKRWRK